MMHKKPNQAGFTILELVIATSVFGVMLLLATTGMLEIGRAYYKGITTSKTQAIARDIENDISNSIQNGGGADTSQETPSAQYKVKSGFDLKAECVGDTRYSYAIDAKVDSESDPAKKTIRHALWIDYKKPGTACNPLNITLDDPGVDYTWDTGIKAEVYDNDDATIKAQFKAQQRDMLATNMRLSKFVVQKNDANTGVAVTIRVLYGDDEVKNEGTAPDPGDDTCLPQKLGGQFCAFSELSTFVQKR